MPLIRLLFQRSKRIMIVATVLGLLSGVASTMLIAMIGSALADPAQLDTAFFQRFAIAIILVAATYLTSRLSLIRLTEESYFELQLHLARQILSTPFRRLEEIGAARMLAVLSQDTGAVSSFMMLIPNILLHSSIIVACVVYLLWLSPSTGLLLIGFMVPAIAGYALIVKRGRKQLKLARRTQNQSFQQYEGLTIGKAELSLNRFRRASFYHRLFYLTAQRYRDYRIAGRTLHEAANTWSHVLYFIFVFFMLLLAAGTQNISTAVLTGFALVALYMRSSIATLLNAIPTAQYASVAMEAINNLALSDPLPGIVDSPIQATAAPAIEALDIRHVSYAYLSTDEAHHFRLGPVELSLKAGELVFIAGSNGSGKTTLLKLLVGLYTPDEGEILLDGLAAADGNEDAYRNHFATVFADFYLFPQLLGLDSDEHIAQAEQLLKRFELDGKLKIQDGAFSTADLSYGQRKRLALLTAYLEDRPVYVFDEWAAGQDPYFSEIFYHQLLPQLRDRGKLVIIATHDDHYYHCADRLIKMDYGRITFDGRPQDSSWPAFTAATPIPNQAL